MTSGRIRAHCYISGTVQGVYYRATTREEARELGIDGWVRNVPDGRVEAVFEGPEETVNAMIEWCYEGSPGARVTDVSVSFETPKGLDGFDIRW